MLKSRCCVIYLQGRQQMRLPVWFGALQHILKRGLLKHEWICSQVSDGFPLRVNPFSEGWQFNLYKVASVESEIYSPKLKQQ